MLLFPYAFERLVVNAIVEGNRPQCFQTDLRARIHREAKPAPERLQIIMRKGVQVSAVRIHERFGRY